jgi:hypothetical protein
MTTFKKLPTAPPVANNQTATAMSAAEDIWDFRFGISDFRFGIWDLGFGIWDLGFGI